ncbi:unnamed protein product [Prorocentrum cordatum]|uniref:Ion transport domain-containing protein n=1 Tax=Prorocentrum cordatum TaxID=2364126 RepID=A0ABN9SC11_9DINO|nr:unnamed protein product [Polarella glacialis]
MRARPRLAGLHRWSAPRSSPGAAARISEGSSRHSSIAEHGPIASASLSVKGERQFRAAVRLTHGSMRRSVHEGTVPNNDRLIASIVKGRTFSIGIACLIVVSTVMIGIETQLLASLSERGPGSETWITALSITNYVLTFLFTVEMVLRLYVFRLDFFLHERVWNLFDVLILLLALGEVALEVTMYAVSDRDISLSDHGGSSKVLRLFRLTRLLRLVRTFRQLKPLRLLLHSLYCAGKSVFWALLLLFTIVYSFGVILTQAVTEHTDAGTRVEDEFLISYYGNLYRSMLSLWWAVSGGISWYELTDPLERTGNAVWSLLFLAYIAFVYFFIFKRITRLLPERHRGSSTRFGAYN